MAKTTWKTIEGMADAIHYTPNAERFGGSAETYFQHFLPAIWAKDVERVKNLISMAITIADDENKAAASCLYHIRHGCLYNGLDVNSLEEHLKSLLLEEEPDPQPQPEQEPKAEPQPEAEAVKAEAQPEAEPVVVEQPDPQPKTKPEPEQEPEQPEKQQPKVAPVVYMSKSDTARRAEPEQKSKSDPKPQPEQKSVEEQQLEAKAAEQTAEAKSEPEQPEHELGGDVIVLDPYFFNRLNIIEPVEAAAPQDIEFISSSVKGGGQAELNVSDNVIYCIYKNAVYDKVLSVYNFKQSKFVDCTDKWPNTTTFSDGHYLLVISNASVVGSPICNDRILYHIQPLVEYSEGGENEQEEQTTNEESKEDEDPP